MRSNYCWALWRQRDRVFHTPCIIRRRTHTWLSWTWCVRCVGINTSCMAYRIQGLRAPCNARESVWLILLERRRQKTFAVCRTNKAVNAHCSPLSLSLSLSGLRRMSCQMSSSDTVLSLYQLITLYRPISAAYIRRVLAYNLIIFIHNVKNFISTQSWWRQLEIWVSIFPSKFDQICFEGCIGARAAMNAKSVPRQRYTVQGCGPKNFVGWLMQVNIS